MRKPNPAHIYTEEFLRSKKFNLLTFISSAPRIKNRMANKWKCDCGTEFVCINTHDIVSGKKKSCCCLRNSKGNKSHRWKGTGEMSGNYWNMLSHCAKERNLDFLITPQYVWKLFLKQNRKCALTGESIRFETCHRSKDGTASLDRIDSSKGYIRGNVQWVHRKINMMKNCYEENDFISWCKKVADFN